MASLKALATFFRNDLSLDEAMVDVTEDAKKAGLKFQTYVTPEAWKILNEAAQANKENPQKTLKLLLYTLNIAINKRRGQSGEAIYFSTSTADVRKKISFLRLKAIIACSESGDPMITVGSANEEEGTKMKKTPLSAIECECFKRMCKHYNGTIQDDEKASLRYVCKAFPKGIPDEIRQGRNNHLNPLPEQNNNIFFEKIDSYAEMEMFKSKRGAF